MKLCTTCGERAPGSFTTECLPCIRARCTTKDLLTRLTYMEEHRDEFSPEDVSLIRDAAKRATKPRR